MGLWKFLAFAKLISWENFKSELVSLIPGPVWVFFPLFSLIICHWWHVFIPSWYTEIVNLSWWVVHFTVYTEKTHQLFQMLDWLNFQHGTMMLCCLVWITVRLIRLSLEQPWYTEYVAQGCHCLGKVCDHHEISKKSAMFLQDQRSKKILSDVMMYYCQILFSISQVFVTLTSVSN